MQRCEACGETQVGGRFCAQCGAPVSSSPVVVPVEPTWPGPAAAWPTPAQSLGSAPEAGPAWPTPDGAGGAPEPLPGSGPVQDAAPDPPAHRAVHRWLEWLRPGYAVLLILLALVGPWVAFPVARGDSYSTRAPVLTILALLLVLPAAVLPRLKEQLARAVPELPARGLRLSLAAPAAVAVLVAVVQHAREAHVLGPGVLLAAVAVGVVVGTDVPPSQAEAWRLAAVGVLVLSGVAALMQLRDLQVPGSSTYVLLGLAWTATVLGGYLAALLQRVWSLWLAILLVAGGAVLWIGLVPSSGRALSSITWLLLLVGLTLGATEGVGRLLGLPDRAGMVRDLPKTITTVWGVSGAFLVLVGLVRMGSGFTIGFGLWPVLLGLATLGATAYLRSCLPTGGRQVVTRAAAVAGAGAFLSLAVVLLSRPGGGPGLTVVIAPLVLVGVLVLPGLKHLVATASGPVTALPTREPGSAPVRGTGMAASLAAGGGRRGATPLSAASPAPGAVGAAPAATLGARLGARLIDGLVLGAASTVLQVLGLLSVFAAVDPYTGAVSGAGFAGLVVFLLLVVALTVLYEVVMIARYGATLGKLALKLRVVTMQGTVPPGWGPSGRRYAVQLGTACIPFVGGLLLLASIAMDESGPHRGWHDKFADTRVVNIG